MPSKHTDQPQLSEADTARDNRTSSRKSSREVKLPSSLANKDWELGGFVNTKADSFEEKDVQPKVATALPAKKRKFTGESEKAKQKVSKSEKNQQASATGSVPKRKRGLVKVGPIVLSPQETKIQNFTYEEGGEPIPEGTLVSKMVCNGVNRYFVSIDGRELSVLTFAAQYQRQYRLRVNSAQQLEQEARSQSAPVCSSLTRSALAQRDEAMTGSELAKMLNLDELSSEATESVGGDENWLQEPNAPSNSHEIDLAGCFLDLAPDSMDNFYNFEQDSDRELISSMAEEDSNADEAEYDGVLSMSMSSNASMYSSRSSAGIDPFLGDFPPVSSQYGFFAFSAEVGAILYARQEDLPTEEHGQQSSEGGLPSSYLLETFGVFAVGNDAQVLEKTEKPIVDAFKNT